MRLLPSDQHPGWVRFIWLAYLVFFFTHPVFDHVGWKEWTATILGVAAFLCLYFGFFWLKRPRNLVALGAMVLLGVAFAPYNAGAAAFFIYASSFIPFAVETEWSAAKLLALLVAIIGIESWLLHLPLQFTLIAAFFSIFIGSGNIYFAQRNRSLEKLRLAQEEIEHLAKVAERERIARDLHDVLGHTLSLIVVKSELAVKLMDRYPERAKQDVEDIQQAARQALTEVRSTIRGYRAEGLDEELKRAAKALESAGVNVKAESDKMSLSPAQETVVALLLREAVTNVVRHAQAHNCMLRLQPANGDCLLEIKDDGRGGQQIEGNGLRGMRERIEALGGTFERDTTAGTRLTIRFPLSTAPADKTS